jgi:hypothetical protein
MRAQVLTDAARVRQIVMNGLTNAIKYAPPGRHGPIVVRCDVRSAGGGDATHGNAPPAPDAHATVHAVPPAGQVVAIQIVDCGPGLQGQTEATLFADFAAHVPAAAGARSVGSSGLGLAICNRLSRLLGGELHLGDRVDGATGTRFVLTLPLPPHLAPLPTPSVAEDIARAATPATDVQLPPPPPPAALSEEVRLQEGAPMIDVAGGVPDSPHATALAVPDHGSTTTTSGPHQLGLHVLLVDDSAGNRRVGARMLAALGCTCETASDGDEVRSDYLRACVGIVPIYMRTGFAATTHCTAHSTLARATT